MKTAYELAMERLNKSAPAVKLTGDQKRRLAELESQCRAKIAEQEIHLKEQIEKASTSGDFEKAAQLEKQLTVERRKLQASLEEKKDAVRQNKSRAQE